MAKQQTRTAERRDSVVGGGDLPARGSSPADPQGESVRRQRPAHPDVPGNPHDRAVTRNPEPPGRQPDRETGDRNPSAVPHPDYPETPSQTANPAPDEQGTNAVSPRDAVGSPEERARQFRYPHSGPEEGDGEQLTREQWQSLPPRQRPEWPEWPDEPDQLSEEQRNSLQGGRPSLGIGDVWRYSGIIAEVIQLIQSVERAQPGDTGDLPPLKSLLPNGHSITIDGAHWTIAR